MVSTRAQIITRRTYNRPLNEEGTIFETWEDTVNRVISHQQWLWERALTHKKMPEMPLHDITEDMNEWDTLSDNQISELMELRDLILERKVCVAGRTLWLGGTDIGKTVELSQFNCAFIKVVTVHDMVDLFWGLLNGAGVTGLPEVGTLTGFRKRIPQIEIIRTKRLPNEKGPENNSESWDPSTDTWTIKIGDSARAWAKSIGKLLACKYPAKKLVLDFSQIRGAGARLRNYGWLSQSDNGLATAYLEIFNILNAKADSLLSEIDIGDIINLLGTVLSTRRAAEALLMSRENPRWKEFVNLKANIKSNGKFHRYQSNNSLLFFNKPSHEELTAIFGMLNKGGNGEPGFVNAQNMLARAPWAKGLNPSLRKGTKVFTDKGIVPIETLEDTYFKVFTIKNKIADAACRLSGRNKQLYKITLEGGHEYYATKEHNWPIIRKTSRDVWAKEYTKYTTEELLPGDALVNLLRDSLYPEAIKGTYNEGFFLGWLLGDGWITKRSDNNKYQIGLILSDEDYNSPIKARIEEQLKILGSNASLHRSSNNAKSWELNTQNSKLWDWISDMGVTSKEHLPSTVFSAEYSEEFRKGFIDATISSDGTIEKTSSGYNIRIGITTSSKSRHTEITELLGFYGIKTAITCSENKVGSFPNGKIYDKTYTSYVTRFSSAESLVHFHKLIKLTHPRKQALIDSAMLKVVKPTMSGKIRIDSIEPTTLYEDVYDIGVYDGSHTFQLAHGITGNCFEILLPDGGTCNLVTIDLAKFKDDMQGLLRATELISRANYRQTIVDFNDGILQEKWNLSNAHLHLCGISLMGIAMRPDMLSYDYRRIERMATHSAYTMAEELGTPYPKNISALKPEGTISKCYDSSEGVHTPLGKYLFNNVSFGVHDPLIPLLRAANYKVMSHPSDPAAVIITLPVKYDGVEFTEVDGVALNLESAVSQLDRYKMLMDSYCHQNVSCTISYSIDETEEIVDWLYNNWNSYVAVSFLFRNDHTKTAEDLGYAYLPQQIVTQDTYDKYVAQLLEIDLDSINSGEEISGNDCATGACPIR